MGRPEEDRTRHLDELRWYEIMFCCCKFGGECKSCVSRTWLYFVPIITLLLLGGACVAIGVIWREVCCYKPLLPYWIDISSVTPFLLLTCIKAIKDDYNGTTFWRQLSFVAYVVFTGWLIFGTNLMVDTYLRATKAYNYIDCEDAIYNNFCHTILIYFALAIVCVHWLLVLLSTAAQVFIMSRICCCCTRNTIKPLRRNMHHDDDI